MSKTKGKGWQNQKWWLPWQKLLNKAAQQTMMELQAFLNQKGLMEEIHATDKAYQLGFVREDEQGRERWSLRKYINMMKADKKVKKLQDQGKRIHPALVRRALEMEHLNEMDMMPEHLKSINR